MTTKMFIDIRKVDKNWYTYHVGTLSKEYMGHGSKMFVATEVDRILNHG